MLGDKDFAIRLLEPLSVLAERYWHERANLRLAAINMALYMAYMEKAFPASSKTSPVKIFRIQWAQTGLKLAEMAMTAMEYHGVLESYELKTFLFYFAVAKLAHVAKDRNRLLMWLQKAKQNLEQNEFVELVTKIQTAIEAYAKGEESNLFLAKE